MAARRGSCFRGRDRIAARRGSCFLGMGPRQGGRGPTDVVGGDDELGAVVAHEGEHHEVAVDGLEEEEGAVVARPAHLRGGPRAAPAFYWGAVIPNKTPAR